MSVDRLQGKIRKMKCPVVLEFPLDKNLIPPHILLEESGWLKAYARYTIELLEGLRDSVPAVRFHFSDFSVLGSDGILMLSSLMNIASKLGYYVLMDGPEALSAGQAALHADILMGDNAPWDFDGLILSQFIGTDAIKPYVAYLKNSNKGLFAVVRTGNKSGPELHDLMTGSRLVHMAQADLVNRLAEPNLGKSGFCALGLMAAATNIDSLLNLRSKFRYLFILIDGFDSSNANAKNCAAAFNNLGHGAAICVGASIFGAWKNEPHISDCIECAKQSVERIKKNMGRYITVL